MAAVISWLLIHFKTNKLGANKKMLIADNSGYLEFVLEVLTVCNLIRTEVP